MKTVTARWSTSQGWPDSLGSLDSPSTLVLAFGGSDCLTSPRAIEELKAAFPKGHVLGCSTSGQIRGESVQDEGVDAIVMRFEHASLRVHTSPVKAASDSFQAGQAIGRALSAENLRGVFVLSDGLHANGTQLCNGLASALPSGTSTTGGLAGDGSRFEHTWVACDGPPAEHLVAAVGLYGDESVALWHGCQGGWDTFGPERKVTKSADNVLFELDGEPALQIYERYLGDHAAHLPASALLFPLSVKRPGYAAAVVRTVLGVSKENGSMTFAGDIPQGSMVQLMRADFDRLIDGASQAAGMIPLPASVSAACVPISCVGRRLILKHRTEEELEEIAAKLGPGVPQVGFYSYGEICPSSGPACELHNQTITLTVFAEVEGGVHAPHTRASAA